MSALHYLKCYPLKLCDIPLVIAYCSVTYDVMLSFTVYVNTDNISSINTYPTCCTLKYLQPCLIPD